MFDLIVLDRMRVVTPLVRSINTETVSDVKMLKNVYSVA